MSTTSESDPSAESTVGSIATLHPEATRVFARHGIDYCCGGGVSLARVAAQRGLDPARVLDELRAEVERAQVPGRTWDAVTPAELVDHVVATYHRPLDDELPRLEAMARKVCAVHGERRPEQPLFAVLDTLVALRSELEAHMATEEDDVFPRIRRGERGALAAALARLEDEHVNAGAALARLRALTGGYVVPDEACNTWRALWYGLAGLEAALHEHVHLENNVLFPRALAAGQS